jgi:hypothetical protein
MNAYLLFRLEPRALQPCCYTVSLPLDFLALRRLLLPGTTSKSQPVDTIFTKVHFKYQRGQTLISETLLPRSEAFVTLLDY